MKKYDREMSKGKVRVFPWQQLWKELFNSIEDIAKSSIDFHHDNPFFSCLTSFAPLS